MIVNFMWNPSWDEEQAAIALCEKLGYISHNTMEVTDYYGNKTYVPIWRVIAEERRRFAVMSGLL